jgi:hypothetical protein
MANIIFQDFLDIFLIIYLDDRLIYSRSQVEHDLDVHKVLKRLTEYGLYAKLEKWSFDCDELEFLGYTILSKGIVMDVEKSSNNIGVAHPKFRPQRCRSVRGTPLPNSSN